MHIGRGRSGRAGFGRLRAGDDRHYLTVTAPAGVAARITATRGAALTVNGVEARVSISGFGIDADDADGVVFSNGARLSLDRMEININRSGVNTPHAIRHHAANGVLVLTNSVLRGATRCFLAQGGAEGPVVAAVFDSRAEDCEYGFVVFDRSKVTISRSAVVGKSLGSCFGGFLANARASLDLDSDFVSNCKVGVTSGPFFGIAATVTVANSVVTENEVGLEARSPNILRSFGNNRVYNNVTDSVGVTSITSH